jgi:hypothetical protein
MGIAGVEPRQLAPTMGTTGSGSTDSPTLSPTTIDIDIDATLSAIDIDATSSAIDIDATSSAIDIDAASTTVVSITAPTVVDTALPTTIESAPVFAIDPPVTTVVDPISCLTGSTSERTGGFDMTLGLFNFHVDDDGAAELIFIIEPVPLMTNPDAPLAIGGTPSTPTPPTPSEEDPRLETSTPSVGSNDFQEQMRSEQPVVGVVAYNAPPPPPNPPPNAVQHGY